MPDDTLPLPSLPADLEVMEPGEALRALDAAWTGPLEAPPKALPVERIEVLPSIFQLRGAATPNSDHVETLRRHIKNGQHLDPIEVLAVGGRYFVIDGHHRLEAYQTTKEAEALIRVFRHKPSMAVLRAAEANSKQKLMMQPWERSEAAWRMVKLEAGGIVFSKKHIAQSASVSPRTVASMRAVLKALQEQHPDSLGSDVGWIAARALAEGKEPKEWTEEDVDKQAQEYAERMRKALGPKFVNNPTIAAKAIVALAPNRARQIAIALAEEVALEGDEWGEQEGEETDF